jgi:hypothetical protein
VTDNLASSDQTEGPFSGIFPRFAIGTNNIRIQSGGIVNQRSSDDTIPSAGDSITFADDTTRFAVSFQVPYTDETFGAIILALTQSGSPPVNLKAEIYDDDGGQPGSSIVSIDQFTTAGMPIYPTFGYIQKAFTSPHTFVANTPYWIVVSAAATGLSSLNLYRWYNGASATYSRGRSLISTDSGVSWEESNSIPSFRLLMGGASGAVEILHTVSYRKAFL